MSKNKNISVIAEPLPISVIVPLYNKAKYIRQTLESILSQTYAPQEIIVVNDGSTDDGADRVTAINHSLIRLIHQDNIGPGGARNRGLRESSCPYVSFLDADDEWMPNFLEVVTSKLRVHPKCAMAVSAYFRGSTRRNWVSVLQSHGITAGEWRLPANMNPRKAKICVDMLHSGAIVCDRDVVQSLGGFYEKNRCTYGEDTFLWLQVILKHPIYRILEPLMWYNTEGSSLELVKRTDPAPPWPMLFEPHTIRMNCPEEYHNFLDLLLAYYALVAAERAAKNKDFDSLHKLVDLYPDMSKFFLGKMKVNLQVLISRVPGLRKAVTTLKSYTKLRLNARS